LENLARRKAELLVKIEKVVFDFSSANDGRIVLKHPQYWMKDDENTVQVFLKIRP